MFYSLLCSRFYKSSYEGPRQQAQNKFHITNFTYGGFGSIAETLKNHSKPFEKWGKIDFEFAKEQQEANKFNWNWTTGGFGSISETLKNKSLPFERWGKFDFSWAKEQAPSRNAYGGLRKVKRHHRVHRAPNKFKITNFTYGGEGSIVDTLKNHSLPFHKWGKIDFEFAKQQEANKFKITNFTHGGFGSLNETLRNHSKPFGRWAHLEFQFAKDQDRARNAKTAGRRHTHHHSHHHHHHQANKFKITNFTYGGEGSIIDTLKNHSLPFHKWGKIDFEFAKQQEANKFKITNFTHGGYGSIKETLKDPRKSFHKWGRIDFTFGDDKKAEGKTEQSSTSSEANSNVHPHEAPGRWARASNNYPRKPSKRKIIVKSI